MSSTSLPPLAVPDPYDARSIVVLSGLAAVRHNPSMYIGSTDLDGLHHLVVELVDNAVDEAEAGFCGEIVVTLHADGSCSVADDGRGIPVDLHPEANRPACEVVLTTLHSGAKFASGSYGMSAGLHGVGVACVNALSEWLELDVWRDGSHVQQRFARGEPLDDPELAGPTSRRGTRIRFRPDPLIFDDLALDGETVLAKLEETAFLRAGLRVTFVDEPTGEVVVFSHDTGVRGILDRRIGDAVLVHAEPIVLSRSSRAISVDAAFCWTDGYAEDVRSFVNGVRTDDGGTHVDGVRAALASTINRFAVTYGLSGELADGAITTVDVLEGLIAAISVRMESPRFGGQTKKQLQSPEAGRFVQRVVEDELARCLEADRDLGRRVVQRALDATRARMVARLASRTARFEKRELTLDYEIYRRQFGIRSRNWHESCTWLTDAGLLSGHAALCDVEPDAEMLDVCCGSGVVGAAFKGKVGRSIGLDITPEMVSLASTRLDEVHQGTVYDLPFEDDRFDLVVNREVLHLLPQPERPVAEIYRVLKPGGQFIVGQIVPYGEIDAFWMFRIFKKKQPLLFQMFLEPEFRALLLDAGFTDLRMEEHFVWESIDRWIDTHETTPAHRQEIYRLFHDAPSEVRAVHPFEIGADGSVRDRWRWCVYSLRKPLR